MPPATVIFDMDDVLCHYDLGRRLRALSRLSGQRPRDIRAAIWDSGFEGDSDAGGYPDADLYLQEFGQRLGYAISRSEWVAARRESMVPKTEVLALVRAIGKVSRLAIYTNNGPLVKQHLDELFPEAAALFDERYCSYEFATKKPDPTSFRSLLERMRVEASQCWFIDDKRSNVQGARLAGIRSHHYRQFGQLLDEARELGFEV